MPKPKAGHPLGRDIKKQIRKAVDELPADIKKGVEGYEKVCRDAQEALKRRPPLRHWDRASREYCPVAQ